VCETHKGSLLVQNLEVSLHFIFRKSLQNNRVSCRLNTEDDTMTVSFLETLTNVVLQLASPDSQKSLNKYLIFSLLKRQESLRKREPIPSELIGSNTSAIADDLCKVKKPRIDKKPLKAPGRSMVNPGSRKITTKRGVNFDDD